MKNLNRGSPLNNSIDKLSEVTFKDWDWNMIEKFDISCSYTYRCTQWAVINTSKLKLEKIEVEKDFSYEYFWFLVVPVKCDSPMFILLDYMLFSIGWSLAWK